MGKTVIITEKEAWGAGIQISKDKYGLELAICQKDSRIRVAVNDLVLELLRDVTIDYFERKGKVI